MAERNHKQDEAQSGQIDEIVASAVARALQAQIPALQGQIVQQVLEALPPQAGQTSAPGSASSKPLVHAVANIHAGTTKKKFAWLIGRRQ